MLDLSKTIIPDCITCGTKPIINQRESRHKTSADNFKEWHTDGHFVLEIKCPMCGRYCETYALNQEWLDQHPNVLNDFGWSKKYHHFVGCQAPDDDEEYDEETDECCSNGCSDNEGFTCEECPHWRTTRCENCGCIDFEFVRQCTPEDDPKNYKNKCMYKCAKCGRLLRVWNY